ncbi:MAG: ribonuclease P protein component [Prevotella sp.]|nr:ribonuclease P protein component [Prevotella sp.]
MVANTLKKRERLCSMKLIDRLFNGAGSHSMAVFPIRVVWMEKDRDEHESPVQILVSVSKRHFKQAVKRNRVKRQVREAYRQAKSPLYTQLEQTPQRAVLIAFIWLSDELYSSAEVTGRMEKLIQRITERL